MRRGRSRLTVLIGLLATAAVLALGASTASAVIVQVSPHHDVSYQAVAGTQPAPPRNFDGIFHNLDYNGGPVMPSNANYAIYWLPTTFVPPSVSAYPSDYQPGINQYFTDIAHDSGLSTNVDAISTQYKDAAGNVAAYKASFGGAIIDTNPYPSSGCAAATVCLTDDQIQTEISNVISAHGLPRDLRHQYFLLTPPGVESCFTATDNICSLNSTSPYYCAYHSASTTGGDLFVYANDPYVTAASGTSNGCDTGNHPNGRTSDGALEGGLSHEHNESVTDPLPNTAYTDYTTGSSNGYENGDKCSRGALGVSLAYGTPIGHAPNGSPYNQVINGREYYFQQEWSNQPHTSGENTLNGHCLQSFSFAGVRPAASFTSSTVSGTAMHFDASASTAPGGVAQYHWQFVDPNSTPYPTTTETETTTSAADYTYGSPGTYRVSLTVYAADGTSAATSRTITTGSNGPNPSFNAPASGVVGRPVSFTDTTAGSGNAESWNFGDDTATGTGPGPQHTYSGAGAYTVTLALTDSLGQVAYTSKQVLVRNPPRAAFAVTTAHRVKGSPVKFSSTGSSSPNGSITSYAWNFGDGSAAGSGASPKHTFKRSGTFTVRLTVTDSVGVASFITHPVVVLAPARVTGYGVRKSGKSHFLLVHVNGAGVVKIGKSSVRLSKPGTASFKLKLSKAQLQKLKKHKAVKFTVKVTFTPKFGVASTHTVRVTLHS